MYTLCLSELVVQKSLTRFCARVGTSVLTTEPLFSRFLLGTSLTESSTGYNFPLRVFYVRYAFPSRRVRSHRVHCKHLGSDRRNWRERTSRCSKRARFASVRGRRARNNRGSDWYWIHRCELIAYEKFCDWTGAMRAISGSRRPYSLPQ